MMIINNFKQWQTKTTESINSPETVDNDNTTFEQLNKAVTVMSVSF